ncbi:MAG: STM4504/CBY_0614 family protein [Chlamydiales bacterium]
MVFSTYSKRQKEIRGESQEIYIYDVIPKTLKIQIVHIWEDSLGNKDAYYRPGQMRVREYYECIVNMLRKELGVFILPPASKCERIDYRDELIEYFIYEKDIDKVLDVIEFSFNLIDIYVRDSHYQFLQDAEEIVNQAISELNARFKEHCLGYLFEDRQIIRVDSEFIHTEMVKPALKLLNKPEYAGAQNEFLNACEHYRNGRKKEVLNDCLRAFESLMKAICKKREWSYPSNATASKLIKICISHKLIPLFYQSKLESLQSFFESGIPAIRNKLSGHGQGEAIIEVPDCMVAHALHETASILILFDQAETELIIESNP